MRMYFAGCGGYLNGDRGSFSYPRTQGSNYSHSVSCAWQITTNPDKVRILRVGPQSGAERLKGFRPNMLVFGAFTLN